MPRQRQQAVRRRGAGERQCHQQDQKQRQRHPACPQADRHRRQRRGAGRSRHSSAPPTAPISKRQIWTKAPLTTSRSAAAKSARAARARSGQRFRAMLHTACATTATATSFKPCKHRVRRRPFEPRRQQRKAEHHDRRGQREAAPGGERPSPAGAAQPDQEAGLAAGRTRHHLAQGDEPGIFVRRQPLPLSDIGPLVIAEMGDRTAERGQPEPSATENTSPAVPR